MTRRMNKLITKTNERRNSMNTQTLMHLPFQAHFQHVWTKLPPRKGVDPVQLAVSSHSSSYIVT